MFDIYQRENDPMARIIVRSKAELPKSFDATEWKFMGTRPSVAEDMEREIREKGFYAYRSTVHFSEQEVPGLPPNSKP